jgi:hypothetical protein
MLFLKSVGEPCDGRATATSDFYASERPVKEFRVIVQERLSFC